MAPISKSRSQAIKASQQASPMADREFMMERFEARDARFDGRFLTGVFTTGIYCLPSCPARKPKRENVGFFADAESAKAAGLRPCKRCRPDDFLRGYDPDLELARGIGREVRQSPQHFKTVATLAKAFAISTTRCTEITRRYLHRSPGDLLNQARVDHARDLLIRSERPVLEVAQDVGFESLSAFNSQFRRRVGMRPRDWRRLGEGGSFGLLLPSDYPHDYVLGFLGRDPASPTESVSGRSVRRALRWRGQPFILHLQMGVRKVTCRLEGSTGSDHGIFHEAYRVAHRLLGLSTDTSGFRRHLERNSLEALIQPGSTGLRIPQTPTVFEGLVWSIVGQQVNLAFAYRLRRILIERAQSPSVQGLAAHPTPDEVAELSPEDLGVLGYSRRKAEYVIGLARSITNLKLGAEELARETVPDAERILLAQRGLGPWATHYVMMRSLGFADCVPVGDTGLATALQHYYSRDQRPKGGEVLELMQPFAPYRSLATTHLWSHLGAIA
ncbi:MAG: helix-turn-helix domain-containing protein [Thermoanaerobaculia bacterium]|nr:helix-turn-helix domain-containing protein [Thermoanaerobaculia bacterium]